jgi:hypothetical protein
MNALSSTVTAPGVSSRGCASRDTDNTTGISFKKSRSESGTPPPCWAETQGDSNVSNMANGNGFMGFNPTTIAIILQADFALSAGHLTHNIHKTAWQAAIHECFL